MQLTEKAIRCQELGADKTLSFGCIIKGYSDRDRREIGYMLYVCNEEEKDYQPRRMHVNTNERSFLLPDEGYDYDIIGHPLNRGRLMYLRKTILDKGDGNAFCTILKIFDQNPELYNQTILDRQNDDELMDLIEAFLKSLQ